MPYRRRKTYRKKRTFKRKTYSYKRYRSKLTKKKSKYSKFLGTKSTPFPSTMYTRLSFAGQYALVCTAGAYQIQTFRANSLYDPDLTGSGIQPRYYDTLCGPNAGTSPYNRYRVHGAKITVKFINTNSSGTATGFGSIRARDPNATAWSASVITVDEFSTTPWTKWCMLGPNGNDTSQKTLKMYVPVKRILSIKDLRDSDESAAVYNANPTSQVYFDVGFNTLDGATTTTIQALVKITYYCEFFTQNLVADS